ncbi:SLC13 family permease [Marinospirillum alkaliphilum]|uniref:Na+/H+ antiporter NhaD n=1 Tax=Marinospirillum alkaliphilum DSM 21637 TaxID=1122209 RepID=A0A1K1WNP1_9GAMM|nr:SLC13 family permease [Marinospirillum alkaliphilum]SFX38731.1 Na+/H+ antiporter NhaD [Marinospirillum alkaliphilum DSM 21637]
MLPVLRHLINRITEDRLLLVLLLSLPPLLWWSPVAAAELPQLVEWQTLAALTGLLLLSRGLELSGLLSRLGVILLTQLSTERKLAAMLVLFAATLSALITNDVALFIVIPLMLSLHQISPLPLARLTIFMALAVNAGSSISPIGNPQNLFIWQASGVSFLAFLQMMWPLALGLLLLLLLAVIPAFSSRTLQADTSPRLPTLHGPLLWTSLLLFVPFLLLADAGYAPLAALLVLLVYLLLHPRLLLGIDWLLLVIFLLMFINLGLLARLPLFTELGQQLDHWPGGVYGAGVLLSQVLSNVPATLFLAHFTEDWQALAWGVSVGGFGLALGSLANLIALRLVRLPGLLLQFHYWSIPALLISSLLGGGLLIWLNP